MKLCPVCKRSYEDDTLSFCFDDGAALDTDLGETETVFIPKTLISPAGPMPAASPKRSGSANSYAVLTGLVLLLVVGGLVLFGFLMQDDGEDKPTKPTATQSTTNTRPSPIATDAKTLTLIKALQTYKYDVGWSTTKSDSTPMTYFTVTSIKIEGANVELHYAFHDGVIKGVVRNNSEIDGSWSQSNGTGTLSLFFPIDFQSASGEWYDSTRRYSGTIALRRRD